MNHIISFKIISSFRVSNVEISRLIFERVTCSESWLLLTDITVFYQEVKMDRKRLFNFNFGVKFGWKLLRNEIKYNISVIL